MLLKAIKAYLEANQERRQPSVSMHNIGHCYRELAYRHHKVEKPDYDWQSLLVFQDGHTAHREIRALLRKSLIAAKSCYRLVKQEYEIRYKDIVGHVDGILEHRAGKKACVRGECSGNSSVLEVKTMGERAYREFTKTGDPGDRYAAQAGAYLIGSGLEEWCLVAKRKATAELAVRWYSGDETKKWRENSKKRLDKILNVVYTSSDPGEVEREFHPKKDGTLPWECAYCSYIQKCWGSEGLNQLAPRKYAISK